MDDTSSKRDSDISRVSEELLQLMFRKHDAVMLLIEPVSGRIVEANLAAEKFYGYPHEKLKGMLIWDINTMDPKQVAEELARAAREERNYFIFSHRKANGEISIVEVHSSPIILDGNQILFSIIHDITERKQIEDALLESEEKYRTLVESADDSIILTDLEGKHLFANSAYYSNLGYRWMEDPNPGGFDNVHPDDMQQIRNGIKMLLETGTGMGSYRVRHRNGEWVYRSSKSTLIHDRAGKPNSILTISRDITEQKKAELILQEENLERKKIESSLRARTRELETLFVISTHLSLLQTEDEMFVRTVREVERALESDSVAIISLDPENNQFRFAHASGDLSAMSGTTCNCTDGIYKTILIARQLYQTETLSSDPLFQGVFSAAQELGPAMFIPLFSREQPFGILLVARRKDRYPHSLEEIRLLTTVGEMLGNAVNRVRLHQETIRRFEHLQTLRAVDQVIASSIDLRITLNILLNHVITQLGVDAASVLLLNPYQNTLQFAASQGFRTRQIESANVQLNDAYAGHSVMERRVVKILSRADVVKNPSFARLWDEEKFTGYICVPLIAKGEVKGVLEVYSRSQFSPDEEWVEFLETLAGQAAISVDNTQLFDDLQRANVELAIAYDATIEGWSHAMDLRDRETEGHTKRVTQITISLARIMGIPEKELLHIRRGALLHDIGKMGIPDHILLKPAKLTKEEWHIMRQHPSYALEMLQPIYYLRHSLDIPYCHHERWDGTGYPRGLKGEQIPLSARIFAVVDVWDALTTSRPYRKAMSKKEVLAYIKKQRGTHFDPYVVDVFLKEIKKL